MRTASLALLLLAALGAAAWVFTRPAGAPAPESAPPAESEPSSPEPGRLDPAVAAAAESALLLERSTLADPGSAAGAPGFAAAVPEGEGYTVRVVRKTDGAPLPHAVVYLVDVENVDEQQMRAAMTEAHSLFDLMHRFGVRHRADGAGVARLPRTAGRVWLGARMERWFGSLEGEVAPADGSRIECAEMLTLLARVVDAAGAPQAGVPVQLRAGEQPLFSFVSDAEGLATLQPLDMLLRGRPEDAECSLALGSPFAEPVSAAVDVRAPPAEPVELVLPPHGALEVRVFDAQGAPWSAAGLVLVQRASDAPAELRRDGPAGAFAAVVREGAALARPLGLGLELRVRALRADGSILGETLCAGPAQPGEVRAIELREASGVSFVTGVLRRADGTLLASRRLQCEVESRQGGGRRHQSMALRTDAAGAFRLPIEEPGLPSGAQRRLAFRAASPAGDSEVAEADLSWTLPPGETPLGVLTLELPPLLVAGSVVDEAGQPLAGVFLQARQQVHTGAGQFHWDWRENSSARSGADGSFTIRGRSDSALIRVEGRQEGLWCDAPTVPPGTSGVLVRMASAGSLQGRLLVADPATMNQWILMLDAEEGQAQDGARRGVQAEADGAFAFEELAPGRYRLELIGSGRSEAAAVLEGLVVVAGEACADPRLDPFDAREATDGIRVSAVDEDGAPLQRFQVMETLADGTTESAWAESGVALLPLRSPPARLVVAAEDRLAVEALGSGDLQLTLPRGPRVRLRVQGLEALPAGWRSQLRLRPADPREPAEQASRSAAVDAAGVAEFGASRLGACRVEIILLARGPQGTCAAQIRDEGATIEILDASGVQEYTLRLDPAGVAAAIARLEEQLDG